jgi:hypothetical protein
MVYYFSITLEWQHRTRHLVQTLAYAARLWSSFKLRPIVQAQYWNINNEYSDTENSYTNLYLDILLA